MPRYKQDCSYFTGYKPCKFKRPCEGCPTYEPRGTRIAVISLEAMGAVLRSTCLLHPIRRKFEGAHVTWITLPVAMPLLQGNSMINRVVPLTAATLPALQQLKFDVLFSVDKSFEAGGLAAALDAKRKFGFGINRDGVIVPLSKEASYQYDVGLDDELKFRINDKPETQQVTETMGLEWRRDKYVLELSPDEVAECARLRADMANKGSRLIGFNTGCSNLYSYKKLSIADSIRLVRLLRERYPADTVLLLGGPEDTRRQAEIKSAFTDDRHVINTPTAEGLRRGILWMNLADVVFSGDSLGMHIAIALGKPTVAWFGLSCPQEIDLYDKGSKILAKVDCSPCWKRSCDQQVKCYEKVDLDDALSAIDACFTNSAGA